MSSPSLMTIVALHGGTFLVARVKSLASFSPVEKQIGNVIKVLQTYNGKEYVNSILMDFCTLEGIDLQLLAAYTPQHNGVTKRKNRTLKDMASCMIHARSLDPSFWAKAISCTGHIRNRVPHKAFDETTPFEAWSGRKRILKHLKVFGYPAWAHIPP